MQPMPTWAGSSSLLRVGGRAGGAAACKTGQPHRWQATVKNRSDGRNCPYDADKAACPCYDLAHNHSEVAAEWDWEANGERTPETVTASSHLKATWRCGLCGHSWSASVLTETHGRGCPQCAHEARRKKTRQPSISNGAPHLLAEWDWESIETHGWHPDKATLRSPKEVHWVVRDECKLGLVHSGGHHPMTALNITLAPHFPLARRCVLATPWLCSAQRQQTCGFTGWMEN